MAGILPDNQCKSPKLSAVAPIGRCYPFCSALHPLTPAVETTITETSNVTNLYIQSAPLAATATAFRSEHLEVLEYIEAACQRIDALDSEIKAFLPEPDRLSRPRREALAL